MTARIAVASPPGSRACRVALHRLAAEARDRGLRHRLVFDRDGYAVALLVELPAPAGRRMPCA